MRSEIVSLPGGVRTRVIDEGRGPVLLFLHGNPDNADSWSRVIEACRARHRCIAPDLPGYGRRGATIASPKSFDYGRAAQVRFVDEVLAARGIGERVTLVVHDIGGVMGVPWAATRIERVRAVVYCNTVAFPAFGWFALARRMGARDAVGRLRAWLLMAALGARGGRSFRAGFGRAHPQLDARELDRFTRDFARNPIAKATTLRQFREMVTADALAGYDDHLRSIAGRVPTTTVWGDDDPYIDTRWAAQLLADDTRVLPRVGHWVPLVAPDEVALAITRVGRAAATTSGSE
ncbi:MAG: alpha/beta hydrolase [Myxococcales bacterium]|nr:alpha/beta hydrolase [Myxococcales bacterium]